MPLVRNPEKILRAARGSEPVSSAELVKQLHETGRHAFDLYVRWFTFFVTLNFVALGWLAKRKSDEIIDPVLAIAVCILMMAFIILGALSAGTVKMHLLKLQGEIIARVKPLSEAERYVASSLPSNLYAKNLRMMTIALYFLLGVWGVILWKAFYPYAQAGLRKSAQPLSSTLGDILFDKSLLMSDPFSLFFQQFPQFVLEFFL